MWSNARGCPRVNGGGPLAVLATSVCSGRGGRRLVFWCPKGGLGCLKGGLPPTPPLDDPLGGCCLKGGLPPHPPSTIHSGILGAGVAGGGLCRVGCGVPPQAPGPDPGEGGAVRPLGFVGRRAPDPLRCPGWIPAFAGMTERGARAPSGLCARRLTGQSAQALRARSAAGAAPGAPGGGVGAQPPQKESPRAGGWATSGAARSSGMGVWGAQPPAGDARSPSRAGRPAGGGPPHPHPLPQGARGPDGLPVRRGAWGLGVRCSRRSAGSPRSPR